MTEEQIEEEHQRWREIFDRNLPLKPLLREVVQIILEAEELRPNFVKADTNPVPRMGPFGEI